MASPDGSNRKILKAKKTMPPSCRKQVELLNKSKNVEALKTATIGNNVPSGNQNLSTGIIQSKCRHSENDASSLDSRKNSVCSQKIKVFPQNLIEPVENIVNSETKLEYIDEEVVGPYQKPGRTIYSLKKLFIEEAKDSQNTSEKYFESQSNITRSIFELHIEDCDLKSIYCSPHVLNGIVQIPKYSVTSTLDDKGSEKMVSYLKTNSESESHDKNQNNNSLNSDSYFVPVEKTPNLVNSVSSSKYAADVLKTEESSRTCHSSISDCGSTDSTWHSSLDIDSNNSHNLKKRMFSENKENVKRMKTSEQNNENISVALEKQRTLLEQVRHLIQQEICSINYRVFDDKLKELNERIGKTQCRNKHEAIADELFAKIAKLQRRIKTVLLSQRSCLEPNTLSSKVAYKAANSETLNLDKNQESVNSPDKRVTSANYEHSKPSEKGNEKVNLSLDRVELVSESNDDVMLISVESPNLTTSVTSNPTDVRKITSRNSSGSPDAEMDVTKKKLDSVIDLTKEGLSNCNTESPVSSLESPSKAVLNSKETTPVAHIAAQVPESFEHLPPLPEPPPLLPELVDKIRDTLPPQKPELKVKRVLKPRGIALTWNITKINPKCAPVESYHLFLCHESPNNKLIWKKIGEIKALPLPMACTLSQFLSSNKYYFTVQSKDIFGRYGPFCDIKSIPGFSENLT
ncbi:activating transcription factor 7-interacting protein 2 isoform X1 [Trichechus manatus latirostris]|uniref:Activating transcription factor 7-interacting protein 2 isoform X1 n=1 Tax=Trichechus manatus latirostris TaxID=127582 RepID=A0A2Y9QL82_TRIMA|nr:activating transcription factor 7-interacting protein 2 isoform X1 [Trichechus manatus latirostris]